MIRTRALSLLLLLCATALTAEARQDSVEITGQETTFTPENGDAAELLRAGSQQEISQLTQSWLADLGYLDASADSSAISGSTLRIHVTEGCRYRLESLSVLIDESIPEDESPVLLSESRYTGEIFTSALVRQISNDWLSAFEETGYLLGEFRINELNKNRDNCTIDLNASIVAGEQVTVSGIRFEGVSRNDPEYLRRVTGIRMDERITPGLLERGQRNLINSGLFDDVSPGELIFVDGEPAVLYTVQEQQLNFFDGLIGYVPDATGSGNIAGYGDILLRNTVAEGNMLELRFEQLQPLVSKLNIRAEQHFIGGFPARLGSRLNFIQQDSTYLVRNIELNSGYRLFSGFEIVAHVRAERSSVAGTIGQTRVESSALNSRANFYGLGFNIRNTDRFRVPTRGYEASVFLERGRRFINDDRFTDDNQISFSQTILRTDVRGYIPAGNRRVLAPRVQGMVLESDEFLITDLFRFGGAESLRGFQEDQFRASAAAWAELEGRYLLDRNSYLFVFGAYGIYKRPQLINEETSQLAIQDTLTSLGFGLAFQSPLGVIKFSYAISPNEDLSNGKVHVGITAGL